MATTIWMNHPSGDLKKRIGQLLYMAVAALSQD